MSRPIDHYLGVTAIAVSLAAVGLVLLAHPRTPASATTAGAAATASEVLSGELATQSAALTAEVAALRRELELLADRIESDRQAAVIVAADSERRASWTTEAESENPETVVQDAAAHAAEAREAGDRRFAALAEQVSGEAIDPRWARSATELLSEGLATLPIELDAIDCRSTICRIDLRAESMMLLMQLPPPVVAEFPRMAVDRDPHDAERLTVYLQPAAGSPT